MPADKYADIGFVNRLLVDLRSTTGFEPPEVTLYMFVLSEEDGVLRPYGSTPFDEDSFFADEHPFAVLLLNPGDPVTRHFDLLWRTRTKGCSTHAYTASSGSKCHFTVEHVRGDGWCALRVAAAFAHTFGLIHLDVSPGTPAEEDTSVEEGTISLEVTTPVTPVASSMCVFFVLAPSNTSTHARTHQ
jgi:hypothetical protein